MIKNNFFLKRLSTILIIFTLFCSLITPTRVHAGDYTFYITPSKIYDQHIPKGESKSYSIKVGSRILDSTNEDLKNVEFDIEVSAEFEGEEGVALPLEGIIEIDKTSFPLSPGKSEDINVTISPDENILSGSYVVYINFTKREKVVESSNISTTIDNVLRIPLYVFIGSKEEYDLAVIDYDIIDNVITLGNNGAVPFWTEVKSYFKKLLNPFNAFEVFSDISDRPFFNVIKDEEQVIDFNNDIYVKLKDVVSEKENSITDTKYFYYGDNPLDTKLSTVTPGYEDMEIALENGNKISLKSVDENSTFIKNQLDTMAKSGQEITLGYILENLLVPKNFNYSLPKAIYTIRVKSSSTVPLTLVGEYTVNKNNEEFYKSSILSSTIKPNETGVITNLVTDKDLPDGNYTITGIVKMRDVSKNISYAFKVGNVRNSIKMYCILFLIVYILLIILLILLIIRLIKKNKKIINEENSNDSLEETTTPTHFDLDDNEVDEFDNIDLENSSENEEN